MTQAIRVLVVDDSAFMRYTITRHLQADSGIVVVGSAQDGMDALAKIPSLRPDVITLDVEMPQMDGLTALQRIMTEHPTPVIMLSSLTRRGTRTTIQALMRGAVDFVAKPATSAETRPVMDELLEKIKSAATIHPAIINNHVAEPPVVPLPVASIAPVAETPLKPFVKGDPLVVIGSSTGGPRALHTLFGMLPATLAAAVVIVQHMPAGFTRSLAQRLNEISSLTVQEAADGDRLDQGLALLAPGDFHLQLLEDRRVRLDQGPRCNHVRPSVDVTMETAAKIYGSHVIGVILTGMGADGTAGARLIKAAGGHIIAEDESTSVVYGMPRSVVEAGLADQVIPLPDIARTLTKLVQNGRLGI